MFTILKTVWKPLFSQKMTIYSVEGKQLLTLIFSSCRHGSKVGFLTKCLFFSLLIGFVAVAGLSVGVDDYRSLVSADTIKVNKSLIVNKDVTWKERHFRDSTTVEAACWARTEMVTLNE